MGRGKFPQVQAFELLSLGCHMFPTYSTDHTYGTALGKYLHLPTGKMDYNTKATFYSPSLEQVNQNGDCLTFWYFMNRE